MADERMSGLQPTQEDREWYERTKEENRPLGSRAIDAAESFGWGLNGIVQSSATLRTLMQGVGFLGEKIEEGREALESVAAEEARYGTQAPLYPGATQSAAGWLGDRSNDLRRGSEFLRQGATEFAEDRAIPAIEQATGQQVDPRAAGIYGEAVGAVPGILTEEAVTLGVGTAARGLRSINRVGPPPQLNFALNGATNTQQFSRQVMDELTPPTAMQITMKNPDNIPAGIGQGSAASPEWAPQVKTFFDRREKLRQQYEDLFRRGSSKVGKKLKQIYNDVSSGMSRDPAGNPEAYRGDSTSKKFDQYREVSEAEPIYLEGDNKGKVKYKQQHHLFSKQESHAFVERMIELGDDDDVLSLFIMAEDMDATMGGRLRNMLNMEDAPHNVSHQSRIFDGRELKSKDMKALVQQAKTTDELMELFRKYVTENVKPSMDEAKALEKLYKDLDFNTKQLDLLRDKNMRS